MLSGEKQWSIIQTKTKVIKVNTVSLSLLCPLCRANMPIVYTCAQKLPLLTMAEVAEKKFKEVMDSYEAIKLERRNRSC